MAKIYSGIVLFNPDLNRLLLSLSSISPQVDKVILIDNGSSNIDDVCEAIIAFNNVLKMDIIGG